MRWDGLRCDAMRCHEMGQEVLPLHLQADSRQVAAPSDSDSDALHPPETEVASVPHLLHLRQCLVAHTNERVGT